MRTRGQHISSRRLCLSLSQVSMKQLRGYEMCYITCYKASRCLCPACVTSEGCDIADTGPSSLVWLHLGSNMY